jgi:hypothetical protein
VWRRGKAGARLAESGLSVQRMVGSDTVRRVPSRPDDGGRLCRPWHTCRHPDAGDGRYRELAEAVRTFLSLASFTDGARRAGRGLDGAVLELPDERGWIHNPKVRARSGVDRSRSTARESMHRRGISQNHGESRGPTITARASCRPSPPFTFAPTLPFGVQAHAMRVLAARAEMDYAAPSPFCLSGPELDPRSFRAQ